MIKKLMAVVLLLTAWAVGQGTHTGGGQAASGGSAFAGGLGASFQDVTEIAAPANPAAGNDRLYLNSTTHVLSCLTSSGGNCISSGGAPAWSSLTAPTGALSLTMPAGDVTSFTWATQVAPATSDWLYTAAADSGVSTTPIFSHIDTTGNTRTGPLLEAHTVGTSTALPVQFTAQGTANGVSMNTAGLLAAIGTGGINATQLGGATFAAPGPIGGTTPGSGAFTTISATGQITSTLAIGTAPLVITSTTPVTNLTLSSVSQLPAAVVSTGQTNVYGAFLQDFTSGTMEIPEAAGFTTNVNSTIGLDLTANLIHLWSNNADSLAVVTTSTSTTTTQALFATATAGIYNPRAIAAGDLPTTLTSGTAITNAALTTPTLGTPASGTLTNVTGLPVSGLVSATGAIPTLANGNNPLVINCALTSGTTCETLGETTAATTAGAVENQITTLTTSTAISLQITQGANGPANANAPNIINVSAAAAGGLAGASNAGSTGAGIGLLTGAGSAGGATTGIGGNGGAFTITEGAGGAAGGTATNNGGNGGGVAWTTGIGGAGGSGAATAGSGGSFVVTLGAPGANSATGTAGAVGQFNVTGNAPASTANATGVSAGTTFLVSGIAGGASSNAAGTAGVGSIATINGGAGGAGTGTNAVGGAGGNVNLTAGAGGGSLGTGANANGGKIVLTVGAAGSGGSGAAGNAGTVQFPNGTETNPSLTFAASSTFGFFSKSATLIGLGTGAANASSQIFSNAGLTKTFSSGVYAWNANATNANAAEDTGVSRDFAGGVAIGNGASQNESGFIRSANACRISSNVTLSTSATNICSFSLPAVTKVWAFRCDILWAVTAGTTPTIAFGVNASQTPAGTTNGEATIQTSNSSISGTSGNASIAASGAINLLTSPTLTIAATLFEAYVFGTLNASATAGTFAITSTGTGASFAGTVNPGTYCALW